MLITLILFVALLAISLTAMAPEMVQQMKRDREQELIHRGVQYSRAIQHFYKQYSRYPNTIDELRDSNDLHFLRKRYKDPITGKDFKILHFGDVQMASGPGLQGATSVANMAAGGAAGSQNGGFGQSIFNSSGFGNNSGLGGNSSGSSFGNSGSTFGGGNTFGGNSGSTFGSSGSSFGGGNTFGGGNGGFGGNSNNSIFGGQGNQNAGQPGSATGNQTSDSNQQNSGQPGQPNQQGQRSSGSNNQTFGGGPIVGVVSTSKEKTIRVFNKKDKYNEWPFTYDPTMDTGGLLNAPSVGQNMQQAGGFGVAPNAPNNNQTGQQTGFGFSGGSPFGPQGGQQQPVPVEQPSPYPPIPQQPQQPQFPPEQGPQ